MATDESEDTDYFGLREAGSIVATGEVSGHRPILKTNDPGALVVLIAEALATEFRRGRAP